MEIMERVARSLRAEAILVSKPRLPSLGLAMLAKEGSGVPVIVDVDDLDLAFFGEPGPVDLRTLHARRDEKAFDRVLGGLWPAACEPMIVHGDAVTVSSAPLHDRYGGTVVSHARDERRFDPAAVDRDAARQQLGLDSEDRATLFLGTPQPLKGIPEVLAALRELGDPRYKLVVVGRARGEFGARLRDQADETLRLLPDQPLARLPETLIAADLVCLLQDPASGVSRYQMPAKLTDALAMGIPVLATDVPPLAGLAHRGVIETLDDRPLPGRIDAMLRDTEGQRARAAERRDVFLREFSFGAVRPILADVVAEAVAAGPTPLPPAWGAMLDAARAAATRRRTRRA